MSATRRPCQSQRHTRGTVSEHAVRHALLHGKLMRLSGQQTSLKDGFTRTSENVVYASKLFTWARPIGGQVIVLQNTNKASLIEWIVQSRNIFGKQNRVDHMKVTVLLKTCSGEKEQKLLELHIMSFLGTSQSFGMNIKFRIIQSP